MSLQDSIQRIQAWQVILVKYWKAGEKQQCREIASMMNESIEEILELTSDRMINKLVMDEFRKKRNEKIKEERKSS